MQFSFEIKNSMDVSVMPFEVRAERDLFNTDPAETGIVLFVNIFNVSIDISVVFSLYSTQSAGIAVLFVFFTAIYQTIVVFLEIIMLLYQVSMQIELRKKEKFRTMLAFTSWNVVPFFMFIF